MKRVVSGIAAPFDVVAKRAFRRWSIVPGAIEVPSLVWLLVEHDRSQWCGFLAETRETDGGIWIRGVVRPGRAGERVLSWPERFFSAGLEEMKVEKRGDVHMITSAVMCEVSIVRRAAYTGTRVEEGKE